jgi:ABC-2 type transport system permease protein
MTGLAALTRVEAKLFVREPIGACFGVAFPAILLLVLGGAIPRFRAPTEDLHGERPIDIYLPVVLAMAISTVTMITLLGTLSGYRERGVLRRLATTPASPAALLSAQLAVNLAALVVGSALALAAGILAFGAPGPANIPGTLLAFVLGAAAMCGVGLLIAAVAPSARASSAIGTLAYFPMLFAAGVWTPGPVMPDAVRRVADFTPLGAASQALQAGWAGGWPRPLHLLVMVVTTLACGSVAVRWFRWE